MFHAHRDCNASFYIRVYVELKSGCQFSIRFLCYQFAIDIYQRSIIPCKCIRQYTEYSFRYVYIFNPYFSDMIKIASLYCFILAKSAYHSADQIKRGRNRFRADMVWCLNAPFQFTQTVGEMQIVCNNDTDTLTLLILNHRHTVITENLKE